MTDHSRTIRILSQITDAGEFERLATATLRKSNPEFYENLTHPGMNSTGKTIRSPVDCIAFIPGATPPHMVVAHHATTDSRKRLEKKWLHDPLKATPKKGYKSSTPIGDILKTMSIVEEERRQTPKLRVTLALTTNVEPPEDLTRKVETAARHYEITIDIWSGSRIAHYFDNDPDGQWLRRSFLGIAPQLLSKQLLCKISNDSLEAYPNKAPLNSLVARKLDRIVADNIPYPVLFLLGESGVGKTTSCYKHLRSHVEMGGCALILSHHTLEKHRTIDQALDAEIRNFSPELEGNLGVKSRALCSSSDPFLILVEDINRSAQPAFLLEHLHGWATATMTKEDTSSERSSLKIYCPVWPKTLGTTSQKVRQDILKVAVLSAPFTPKEASAAIALRADLTNISISTLEANSLTQELGNDPLLISLYDFSGKADPQSVVKEFIHGSLRQIASTSDAITLTDCRMALEMLTNKILLQRQIDPTWHQLKNDLNWKTNDYTAICTILKNEQIIRLVDDGKTERIAFRHDRIRACLLSSAIGESLGTGQIDEDLISDPFFADIIGIALANLDSPCEVADQIRRSNPLALLYALKTFKEPRTEMQYATLEAIDKWLKSKKAHGRASLTLRWAALQVLSETKSSHVLSIVQGIDEDAWASLSARLQNGDLKAAIQLCFWADLGANNPWRDRLIDHIKIYHGPELFQILNGLLRNSGLSDKTRSGVLQLAGYLGNTDLENAISACWMSDQNKVEHLSDYLWAAAQCCGEQPEQLLASICDEWAKLPIQTDKEGCSSTRTDIAAYSVDWAFSREGLPDSALRYFIRRAQEENLRWPITYMFRLIDHPDAIEFIVRELVYLARKGRENNSISIWADSIIDDWKYQQRDKNRVMSTPSRQRLRWLWETTTHGESLRREAFLLWSSTPTRNDLAVLRNLDLSVSFGEDILRTRLKLSDRTAIPLLLKKIRNDEIGFWWQFGRYVWSDELTSALEGVIEKRGRALECSWGMSSSGDWIYSELLIRQKPFIAEKIIVKNWSYLRFSPYFVQAALYIATPKTCSLVKKTLDECPDVREMLKHVTSRFGIRRTYHPGVERIEQIEALIPYMDYLASIAISDLWELCNQRGWIDFRCIHLDHRMRDPWRKNRIFDKSNFIEKLDLEVEKEYSHGIDFLIDRYLDQGESHDQIFTLLGDWLEKQRSIPALKLVASAIRHKGRRGDIDLLRVVSIEPVEEVEEIITDTWFEVRRRSLI